jgi:hypothetical protein
VLGIFPGLDRVAVSLRDVVAALIGSLLVLAVIWLWQRFLAAHGVPDFVEYSVRPSLDGKAPLEQLTRGEPLIHLADARAVDAYREHPGFRSSIDTRGPHFPRLQRVPGNA